MDFQKIHAEARAAGLAAGKAHAPTVMHVAQRANPLDDASPVVKAWVVPDGVCGFAWVHMKGNIPFARWAKLNGIAHPGYPKGVDISCRDFNQSMERKLAYCDAYAEVLRKHGIDCDADSRMD